MKWNDRRSSDPGCPYSGCNKGDRTVARATPLGRTIGFVAIVLAPTQLAAQPLAEPTSDGSSPAAGKIAIAVPEMTEPVARSFHVHEGFYARVNAGIGWVGSNWDPDGMPDVEANGTSLALDLLVGGSPSRGVAIGGAALGHLMLSTDVSSDDGDADDEELNLFLVGPFIDGFPSSTGGWHLGGTVGLARARLGDMKGWGLGGAAWAGYDAWVGDEWSVGGLARLMITQSAAESNDFDEISATATTFTLAFTALYH